MFTLFPALQKLLRTPTQQERGVAGAAFEPLSTWLPRFTYRQRWPLVDERAHGRAVEHLRSWILADAADRLVAPEGGG